MGFLCVCTQIIYPQEVKQDTKQEEKTDIKEITEVMPKQTRSTYTRAGRKDPFMDLLAQQESRKTVEGEDGPQVSVENVNIIGIVKARGQFTAIVSGPEDFPLFINESKVTFRKTSERGSPLFKPKDIIKEILIEERR